ncbi:hypothetical protein MRX96_040885 [Rhipicephalus microplus]
MALGIAPDQILAALKRMIYHSATTEIYVVVAETTSAGNLTKEKKNAVAVSRSSVAFCARSSLPFGVSPRISRGTSVHLSRSRTFFAVNRVV